MELELWRWNISKLTYNNPESYNVTLYNCIRNQTSNSMVMFTDSSNYILGGTITTWQWNFGDGIGTSTDQNPSYGYQNFGTFNVQLIITDQYSSAAFTHDTICEGTLLHSKI